MRTVPRILAACMLAAATLAGCSATAGGTVTVLASWTGAEGQAFRQVLDVFEAKSGITVDYHGTRALDQVLASDVRRGDPPDVAVLPNPSALAGYVRSRDLYPLDTDTEQVTSQAFGPLWQELQKIDTRHQYAVAVKADLKSAIWYNPQRLSTPSPTSLSGLVDLSRSLSAPWCIGMAAPPVSGWPGTDWIEDILLHAEGTEAYERFSAGTLAWTSPQVRQAWSTWGSLINGGRAVHGSSVAALLTKFDDAGASMFADPPGCMLEHQASFIVGEYQAVKRSNASSPRTGTDFDFFRFPGIPAAEVSADLAGMFQDTPQARELMTFLASAQGQQIWPSIDGSSAFSVNRAVPRAVYDDPVRRKVADLVATDNVPQCFDVSDLMPADMTAAFYRAVLEFLANPSRLDDLLHQLDKIRIEIPPQEWLTISCGQ